MTFEHSNTAGMGAIAHTKGFLNASGKEKDNAMASVLAQVRTKFPYPPANCDDAMTIISNIEDDLKTYQQLIATGASNKVGQRYVAALTTVRGEFQAYVTRVKCVQAALAADNNAFNDQLSAALDKEQEQSTDKKTIDNWLIYGVLGLLTLTAIIIVVKRS